jgi:hypothetical protein
VPEVPTTASVPDDRGDKTLHDETLIPEEKEATREALLAYCQRDTEAMVRVFDVLFDDNVVLVPGLASCTLD